jgi:acyl-CoA thioester hydrolase
MKFSHTFRVPHDDIDEQGHVNNVAYLHWIQDVAVAHWRHAATEEMQAKFSWVVLRHEIDYKKPAFENDRITATTWVGEWTKVRCERFTEIRRAANLLVKSRTLWCMLERESGKPSKIESVLIERFCEKIAK